jgi:hypothetical protein
MLITPSEDGYVALLRFPRKVLAVLCFPQADRVSAARFPAALAYSILVIS